jgi:hypothetical protein
MDIVEIHSIKNPPQDPKLIEAALSGTASEFIGKNPNVMIFNIEVIYRAGTATKSVKREVK